MPINAGYKYVAAEQEFQKAETNAQRMKALRNMLSTAPTHKGAERLRADIKRRIAQLKDEIVKTKKQGKGKSVTIRREGAAQIAFIGLPNSGKSTLLSKLSGKKIKIAEYEFTTSRPAVAAIRFENIWLQGIEIPAVYDGYAGTKQGRQFLSMVRNADFVVVVCEKFTDIAKVQAELKKVHILLRHGKKLNRFEQVLPHMIVTWKEFNDKNLTKRIWLAQNKIRVQTRVGHKVAAKPIILVEGATVGDVARSVHKDMVRKFRFAKIIGPSAAFENQQVGLEHVLKDTDVLEIFMQ